jgi:hypothetical protein
MYQAVRHEAVDGAGNGNGQDPGDRLAVISHHKLVTKRDSSEVLAQMVAKIPNANFHRLLPIVATLLEGIIAMSCAIRARSNGKRWSSAGRSGHEKQPMTWNVSDWSCPENWT